MLAASQRRRRAVASRDTLRDAAEAYVRGMSSGMIKNRSGDPYKPKVVRDYESTPRLYVLPDLGGRRISDIDRPICRDSWSASPRWGCLRARSATRSIRCERSIDARSSSARSRTIPPRPSCYRAFAAGATGKPESEGRRLALILRELSELRGQAWIWRRRRREFVTRLPTPLRGARRALADARAGRLRARQSRARMT